MVRPAARKRVALWVVLLASAGCNLGTGDDSGIKIGVPYYAQQTAYDCAPAAIQMWAAFDGNLVSQAEIANYVGCTTNGTTPANTVNGVAHFTATKDPYLDNNNGQDPSYFARQITSIDNSRPVLAAIEGIHVGIINGGSWHHDQDTGYYVWDFVFFHDPQLGPNQEYSAGDWMDENNAQVIGQSATQAAVTYLSQYGGDVEARGSSFNPLNRN